MMMREAPCVMPRDYRRDTRVPQRVRERRAAARVRTVDADACTLIMFMTLFHAASTASAHALLFDAPASPSP